jgi:DNA-binding PadR family transcriptional regulator
VSSIRILVLGVVRAFQPVHGYDVRRELLSWHAEEWAHVQTGSIYNALKSLTRDGLLAVEGTGQVGGRPERTSYRLTAEGEEALLGMVRDAWWKVEQPLDPLMPAVSFLWLLRRDELIAALRSRIVQIRGLMDQHGFAVREPWPTEKPAHVVEMFELMRARIGAEIAWAEALIAKLERGAYQTAGDRPAAAGRKPAARRAATAAGPGKRAAGRRAARRP